MDQIRLRPTFIENGSKFTHFLTQFLALYLYLIDVKEVTGRRSGLKIRRGQPRGGSTVKGGVKPDQCGGVKVDQ
jgi:hypothetical protein